MAGFELQKCGRIWATALQLIHNHCHWLNFTTRKNVALVPRLDMAYVVSGDYI